MFTFREINISDAKLLLDWRTKNRVTKNMNTDIFYNLDEQKRFLELSRKKKTYYHWIIRINNIDIGHINFSNWNKKNKTVFWGMYIGEDSALGLGGMVTPFFYNFCFKYLKVESIFAEVIYFNTKIIDLHLLHGYEFSPKNDRIILKNGKELLLVSLKLYRSKFLKSKFKNFVSHFPLNNWVHSDLVNY